MNNDNLRSIFESCIAPFNLSLTDEIWDRFEVYRALLKEWNEKINLTAITDDKEIIVKHFADSLSLYPFIAGKSSTLCDIGTGAGFPGVPLKIVMPGLSVTLVDSLAKRLTFLDTLVGKLGLSGVNLVHCRAEDFGRKPGCRDSFDYVTARAVAPMNVLLEYCLPSVKPGGEFIAMKGSKDEGSFAGACRKLKGNPVKTETFQLSCGDETFERTLFVFEKTAPTPPQYPRKPGIPSKKPLN